MTALEESQARQIARLNTELTEAITALQALTTVAEMVGTSLTAAVLQITKGAPSLALARDLADVEPPAEGGVLVPLHRVRMRQDNPTTTSTPAGGAAGADQTAPTI